MELPLFDPIWLRSFLAVAETLSFTRAAASLGVQQPAVSAHVRKLEATSGARLFVRDTHSVRLTTDGEAMIGFATTILAANRRAMQHFSRDTLSGIIRLGISEDMVLAGFPLLLRQFTKDHPRVSLELVVELSATLRERFEQGDLDLALLKQRVGDKSGEILWTDRLVWIAAPDLVLDPEEPTPLIMLSAPALTRSAALSALEQANRSWHLVCTSDSQSGIHAAVVAGLGVAPHAQCLVPDGLKLVPDDILPRLEDIEFAMLVGRQARRDPARALVETIKHSVPTLRRSQDKPLGDNAGARKSKRSKPGV